jgi:hypothetical protein
MTEREPEQSEYQTRPITSLDHALIELRSHLAELLQQKRISEEVAVQVMKVLDFFDFIPFHP